MYEPLISSSSPLLFCKIKINNDNFQDSHNLAGLLASTSSSNSIWSWLGYNSSTRCRVHHYLNPYSDSLFDFSVLAAVRIRRHRAHLPIYGDNFQQRRQQWLPAHRGDVHAARRLPCGKNHGHNDRYDG